MMNRSLTRFALVAGLALVAAGGLAATASATYHENRIREIHEGGATGDYVELQAFTAGQNMVGGKYINTYDGGGGLLDLDFDSERCCERCKSSDDPDRARCVDGSRAGCCNSGHLNVVNTGGTVCFSTSAVGN